jgi:Tol biopolymer transport system component/tRNA A-37 threonylcarbamoyl transferase component Bud32
MVSPVARTEEPAIAGPDEDAEPPSVRAGEVLGERYEVLAELGRGGQGVVLRARDRKADTVVALKLLDRTRSAERLARFQRELQVARKVTHPSVVRIYDLVELPGRFALSMELVEGEALDFKMARERKLSARDLVALAGDLARALEAAHEAGVVHRDLKPANVILRSGTGRAVVTDFGVSRLYGGIRDATTDRTPGAPLRGTSSTPGAKLTQEGALIGTPEYMAPEQLEGRTDIGPAADVYAFGVVMFEAATGARPHKGPTVRALSAARRDVPAPPLASLRPDLPAGLCAIVDRCLAIDPTARFADGAALRSAIDELALPAVPARSGLPPKGRVAIGGALLVVVAAAVAAGGWALHARRVSDRAMAASAVPSSAPPVSPLVFEPGAPERITFDEGCEEYPSFTPDGERIVYDASGDASLHVMRLTDRSQRVLTHVTGWDFAPSVSPDGTRVAFLRSSARENGLFVTSIDATPDTPVRHIAASNARPSWTPDGRSIWAGDLGHLVRYAAEDAHEGAHLDAPRGVVSLRAIELPSGAVVELFPVVASASEGGVAIHAPDVTAEARWLMHGQMNELLALMPSGAGVLVARQTTIGEDELLTLAFNGSPPISRRSTGISSHAGADFSRDGRKLVYSTCRDVNVIAKVDENGRLSPAIGAAQWNDNDVVALPGQRRIVVISDRNGRQQPWVVDRTGREPPRCLALGRDGSPVALAASPDGRLLAIEVSDKGIATLSVDGDAPAEMLTDGSGDGQPAFSRDGLEVLFTRTTASGRPRIMAVSLATHETRAVLDEGSFAAAVSPADGRIAYLAGEAPTKKSTPMLFDLRTGRSAPLSASLKPGIHGQATFSPDGRRVVLADGRNAVAEVDVATGVVLRRVSDPESQIGRAVYSGDEILLARALWVGDLWLAVGRFE